MITVPLYSILPLTSLAAWVWRAGPSELNFPGNSTWPQGLQSPQMSAIDGKIFYFYGGGEECGIPEGYRICSTLWRFNSTSLNWTLLYGDVNDRDVGITYGSFRAFSANVMPGARYAGAAFYDLPSNSFFLYSGRRFVTSMFQYNITSRLWRWVAGVQSPNVYSYDTTPGMPPTPRTFEQSFYDSELRLLFVFGGYMPTGLVHNDMWMYNATDGVGWSIVRSSFLTSASPSNYGEQGVPSIDTLPGGRYGAAGCYNTRSKIYYMFGGLGIPENDNLEQGYLGDLWSYSVLSKQWTFLSGSKGIASVGNYGPLGVASVDFLPHSRSLGVSAYSSQGLFYLFGGRFSLDGSSFMFGQLSDLWKFNISSSEWTLVAGSKKFDVPRSSAGVGIETYDNIPAARSGGIAYFDEDSRSFNIWGGLTNYSAPQLLLSDLWTFYDRPIPTDSGSGAVRREAPPISNTIIIAILSAMGGAALVVIGGYFIRQYVQRKQSQEYGAEEKFSTVPGHSSSYSTDTNVTSKYIPGGVGTTMLVRNEGLEIPGYLEVSPVDFEFVKSLAAGGGGEVFLATAVSATLKQQCILMVAKVMSDEESFHQEVSFMHLFSHTPYIAKLIGYCSDPFTILMKYYEKGTIDSYVKKYEISSQMKTFFAEDIAQGVCILHSSGISHNDLKPQNVLLDFFNGRLMCVLTDFGISHILDENLLSVKGFDVRNRLGVSILYAAPEAIRRFRTKARFATMEVWKAGDIYSLASIFYFLVAGDHPWSYNA